VTKKYVLGFPFYKTLEDVPADGSRVLLLKKHKPDHHKGLLNGFGGGVNEGEAPDVAMAREFKEEAGISTVSRQWRQFATLVFEDTEVFCFAIVLDEGRLEKAFRDSKEIEYVNSRMLPYNVVPDVRWLIPMALDPTVTSATIARKA
jgi:8-oxo-dGTP diphosphatase